MGGRPFQVWFYRSEETRERSARRIESLTFRTPGRNQSALKAFVDDVVQCHTARLGIRSYLFTYNDGWDLVEGYSPRLLESVVLPPGEQSNLVQDIERFRSSRQRYARMGIPYHRGYLFFGPPGTGKTSLVSAVAAHFSLSIYCFNLADLNDRSLMNAVNQVPANSLLLFEDIDCMKSSNTRSGPGPVAGAEERTTATKKDATDRTGVTLSGLLNVLDGFYAPTGVLFVMTTNHVEALDPALLRPGRIDYKVYLGKAGYLQKVELYLRFFPEASHVEAMAFVDVHRLIETMAEFQGVLLAFEMDQSKCELVSVCE